MKRILFLTPFAPSDIGAAMKFTKTLLKDLSSKYLVDLVYFVAEGESKYVPENDNIRVLETIKVDFKRRLLCVIQRPLNYPIFSTRFDKRLVNKLKNYHSKNQYDLIFLDHSQTFIYGKYFPNINKILMAHDIITQRVSRQSGKLMRKWAYYTEKKYITQPKSTLFSFSEKDKSLINNLFGLPSFVTAGNVDSMASEAMPQKISNYYVFFGQWVRNDNLNGLLWFFDNVIPICSDRLNIKIIGRGLSEDVIEKYSAICNLEYLGFVENPYQIIADCKAVLSPLFSGAGVKFKVLEALACGAPVIGNDISFEGIPLDYSSFMIHANTPQEYLICMGEVDSVSIEKRIEMKRIFLEGYLNNNLIKTISNII